MPEDKFNSEKEGENSFQKQELTKKAVDVLKIVNSLVVAAIIGLVSYIILLGNRVTQMESEMAKNSEIAELRIQIAKMEAKIDYADLGSKQIDIDDMYQPQEAIRKLISRIHNKYVMDFLGTDAGSCFTNDDLTDFRNTKKVKEIKLNLKTDSEFAKLEESVTHMSESEWLNLREIGLNHYDPVGQGKAEAQTNAGQAAQKEISAAIIELLAEAR